MSWDAWTFIEHAHHRLPPGFKHRAAAQAILDQVANDLRFDKKHNSDLTQEQLAQRTGHSRRTMVVAQRALKDAGLLVQTRAPRQHLGALWTIAGMQPDGTIDPAPFEAIIQTCKSAPLTRRPPRQMVKSARLNGQMVKSAHLEVGQISPLSPVGNINSDVQICTSEPIQMCKNDISDVQICTLPQVLQVPEVQEQHVDRVGKSGSPSPEAKVARRRAASAPSNGRHGNRAVIVALAFETFGQRRPLGAPTDDDPEAVWQETDQMEQSLQEACQAHSIAFDDTLVAYAVSMVRQAWEEDAHAQVRHQQTRRRW